MTSENKFVSGTVTGRFSTISKNSLRAGIVFAILLATLALTVALPDSPPEQAAKDNSVFVAVILLLMVIYWAKIYLNYEKIVTTTDIFLIISSGAVSLGTASGQICTARFVHLPWSCEGFHGLPDRYRTDGRWGGDQFYGHPFCRVFSCSCPCDSYRLYAGWKKGCLMWLIPLQKRYLLSQQPYICHIPSCFCQPSGHLRSS